MRKTFTLFLLLFFFLNANFLFSQCTNTSQYPFSTVTIANDGSTTTISTCNYTSEYSVLSGAVSGNDYVFSCKLGSTDKYVTIKDGSGTNLAWGMSPLSWTSTVTGNLQAHWTNDAACSTTSSCHVTTVTCSSCTPPPPPDNDNCDGAYSLTVNSDLNCTNVTAGTVSQATASPESTTACSGTENDDVWFSFVATATTHQISLLNVAGSTTDLYHSVWAGTCPGGLSLVAGTCSDPNISNPSGLTIGNTYYIRVYSYGSTSQTTTFNVCVGTPPPPPDNDLCVDATVLNCGDIDIPGTTTSGTDNNPGTCSTAGDGSSAGVWYTFTGNGNQMIITVNADPGNADDLNDSQLAIYSGTCGSLTCVTGNDDNTPPGGSGSQVTFTSIFGTTYYAYVDGYSTNSGDFLISLECPPENNVCSNAIELANGGSGTITDISFDGTTNSGESDGSCGFTGEGDLFYSITTDDDGSGSEDLTVTATISSGSLDISIYAYDACSGTLLGCSDAGGSGASESLTISGLNFKGKENSGARSQTIIIRIDHIGSGTIDLTAAGAALPIQLASINAKNMGDYNMIEWTTQSEIENQYQEIQKSYDQKNWESLERIMANGNSLNEKHYQVVDNKPKHITYYRHLSKDLDGKSQVSNIIAVEMALGTRDLVERIFPNPTSNSITVDFVSISDQVITVELFDITGKIIYQEKYGVNIGSNKLNLDMSQLSSGVYMLRLESYNNAEVHRITKN
ncbi:MAG TPA: T9SS type A sorting domain-containing protein [Saprospiraceae bacterium]|nr:T9SS type A sorting domain-containing protein [Saprospiraceae bacterium]